MLVLTRKMGESIIIGENVEVRVMSVRGQKVRLAIDAPATTAVNRKEVHAMSQERGWDRTTATSHIIGTVGREQHAC